MDISPYLRAIQLLPGSTPAEKHKHLDRIANEMVSDKEELESFLSAKVTNRVEDDLYPYLRAIIGKKIKSNKLIIESLQSEDIKIVKCALTAKWFFHEDNPLIDAEYFRKNIFPYTSYVTRKRIIKVLTNTLCRMEPQSESFFNVIAEDYDHKSALLFLPLCGSDFIYREVIKYKILIPLRLLKRIFFYDPALALKYLRLGDPKCKQNLLDRKLFTIKLEYYQKFLPQLVFSYFEDFADFCELIPEDKFKVRLGEKLSDFFMSVVFDKRRFFRRPRIYVKMLDLKWLKPSLCIYLPDMKPEFEEMARRLMPEDEKDFDLHFVMKLLDYYSPHVYMKSGFLQLLYEVCYSKSIMTNKKIIDCLPFLTLFDEENKFDFIKDKIYAYFEDPDRFNRECYRLRPQEVINRFKGLIASSGDLSWVREMLKSCAFHKSEDYLLVVLQFYKEHDSLENAKVFHDAFCYIMNNFDLDTFDVNLWKELAWMLIRAFLKQFLVQSDEAYTTFFLKALKFFKEYCQEDKSIEEDKVIFDYLMRIFVVAYLKHNSAQQFVSKYTSSADSIEDQLLSEFLKKLSPTEAETNDIWNNPEIKLNTTIDLIKAINIFNEKYFKGKKKSRGMCRTVTIDTSKMSEERLKRLTIRKYKKITVESYPWLTKFSEDLLKAEDLSNEANVKSFKELRRVLREFDLDFYQNVINSDPKLINDVSSRDALDFLKRDHYKVLSKWKLYLDECRKLLENNDKYAIGFVFALKWYEEIPTKFVDQCIEEIDLKGSALVLGILLEGTVFVNRMSLCLGGFSALNVEISEILRNLTASLSKIFRYSNPTVIIEDPDFYRNHKELSLRYLGNLSNRIPEGQFHDFLFDLHKKNVIHLETVFRFADRFRTKSTSSSLKQSWDSRVSPYDVRTRKLIFSAALRKFKQSLRRNWYVTLIHFVRTLTKNDIECFKMLLNFESFDVTYKPELFKEILEKLVHLSYPITDRARKFSITETKVLMTGLISNLDNNITNYLPHRLVYYNILNYIIQFHVWDKLKCYLFSDANEFQSRAVNIFNLLRTLMLENRVPAGTGITHEPAYLISVLINQLVDKFLYCENEGMMEWGLAWIHGILIMPSLPAKNEPVAYMSVIIGRCSVGVNTCRAFAERVGDQLVSIANIVGEYNVKDHVHSIMIGFVKGTKRFENTSYDNKVVHLCNGLIKFNHRLGSIVAMKLLNEYDKKYHNVFEHLINRWKKSKYTEVSSLAHVLFDAMDQGGI